MRIEVWCAPTKRTRRVWAHVPAALGIAAVLSVIGVDATQAMHPQVVEVVAQHAVSSAFDRKVWPLLLDIGQPLAKTMMAIGTYKMIRNDVSGGWQMVYRAGLGLVALHGINAVIGIIDSVSSGLEAV